MNSQHIRRNVLCSSDIINCCRFLLNWKRKTSCSWVIKAILFTSTEAWRTTVSPSGLNFDQQFLMLGWIIWTLRLTQRCYSSILYCQVALALTTRLTLMRSPLHSLLFNPVLYLAFFLSCSPRVIFFFFKLNHSGPVSVNWYFIVLDVKLWFFFVVFSWAGPANWFPKFSTMSTTNDREKLMAVVARAALCFGFWRGPELGVTTSKNHWRSSSCLLLPQSLSVWSYLIQVFLFFFILWTPWVKKNNSQTSRRSTHSTTCWGETSLFFGRGFVGSTGM